jgi:hypothetical protein
MSYTTGKAKSLDGITLDDVLTYPIWEWALGGETEPGQDETWQWPIISTTDVTPDMSQPTITFRIKGTNEYGSAEYNLEEDVLENISIWNNDEWISIYDKENMDFPVIFVAIPSIKGKENVEFEYTDWEKENATRIK